jgi:SPP1 family predicted phage head-tail adaptor
MKTVNAGKYNHRISIFETKVVKDSAGFQSTERTLVLTTYASIKTTKGMTLIINNSDFEKAYTNFTIRYPVTPINRDMVLEFRGKSYTIEYINNVDERNVELELQCKEITH